MFVALRAVLAVLLATVEPNFEWIRLAQRIPVRIALDKPPSDVDLVSGLSATVTIHPAAGGR